MRQIVENTVKFRIQLKRQLKCRRIDICPLSGDQVVKVGNNRVKQIFFAALQDNFALQSFPQVADALQVLQIDIGDKAPDFWAGLQRSFLHQEMDCFADRHAAAVEFPCQFRLT